MRKNSTVIFVSQLNLSNDFLELVGTGVELFDLLIRQLIKNLAADTATIHQCKGGKAHILHTVRTVHQGRHGHSAVSVLQDDPDS